MAGKSVDALTKLIFQKHDIEREITKLTIRHIELSSQIEKIKRAIP